MWAIFYQDNHPANLHSAEELKALYNSKEDAEQGLADYINQLKQTEKEDKEWLVLMNKQAGDMDTWRQTRDKYLQWLFDKSGEGMLGRDSDASSYKIIEIPVGKFL